MKTIQRKWIQRCLLTVLLTGISGALSAAELYAQTEKTGEEYRETENEETEEESGDETPPVYTVSFSEPDSDAVTEDAGRIYYNNAVTAKITITEEEGFDDALVTIRVKSTQTDGTEEVVICWENGTAYVKNEHYQFSHEPGEKTFFLTIENVAENDNDGYTYEISGADLTGNLLEAADDEAKAALETIRVMDTTAPVLEEISYDTMESFCTVGERDYVNAVTRLTFRVTEEHPAAGSSFVTSDGEERNSHWSRREDGSWETTVAVPMLGAGDEQTVSLKLLDKAGNIAVPGETMTLRSAEHTAFLEGMFQDHFTVDTRPPVVTLEYEGVAPGRENVAGVDYFSQPAVVKLTVEEHNFDAALFEQTVEIRDLSVLYEETPWITEGDLHVKTFTYRQDQQYDLVICGADIAQNRLELSKTAQGSAAVFGEEGMVTLKTAVDQTGSIMEIRCLSAEKGRTSEQEALYCGDLLYQITVYDPLCAQYASGVDHMDITVLAEDGTAADAAVARDGSILADRGISVEQIQGDLAGLARGKEDPYVFYVTVRAEVFNSNGIVLEAAVEDLSGNRTEAAAEPAAIDTTTPGVIISYDQNEVKNEKYFAEPRTATIRVTERNFEDACVQFLVNGQDQMLSFSLKYEGNGNRDDAVWESSHTFDADDDYRIECTVTDLAGNQGNVEFEGEAAEEFTVDQIRPKITVEYDNTDVLNEWYYKEARTATVTVEEHNFSEEEISFGITAEDDGTPVELPEISAWSGEGDFHHAKIIFDRDADYTLDVQAADLAGNEAEDYPEDRFVIDLTPPEIEIYGVEDGSANRGEVRPVIRCVDTNYDVDGTKVSVSGYMHGIMSLSGSRSIIAHGAEFQLDDFAYELDSDDLYTMRAAVSDLAGNRCETAVNFSVNRFGSVYTFDEKTDALVGENGSYYTKAPQEIVVTETNADTLEFLDITLNLNGKLQTLEEKTAYTVTQSGDENSWKQYTYRIGKENFKEEGRYTLTIYSRDRAENTSDNHTKGKQIEFVVDQSAPDIFVTGVEDRGQYRENAKEITLDIEDNVRLDHVEVWINDEKKVYDAASLFAADGRITVTLKGKDQWQTLKVAAYDAAGNIAQTETLRYLLTPNLWVQFYENRMLFLGSVTGGICMAAVFWYRCRKRRENS